MIKSIGTILLILTLPVNSADIFANKFNIELLKYVNSYDINLKKDDLILLRKKLLDYQNIFDSESCIISTYTDLVESFTNLHYYVLTGNINSFKEHLKCSDLKLKNELLFFVAHYGDVEFIEALCQSGVDVNILDNFGNNALIESIGRFDISERLIKSGANYNNINIREIGYLEFILVDGNYDFVKKILNLNLTFNIESQKRIEKIQDIADGIGDTEIKNAVRKIVTQSRL